jgi:alpha-L-fucosidase
MRDRSRSSSAPGCPLRRLAPLAIAVAAAALSSGCSDAPGTTVAGPTLCDDEPAVSASGRDLPARPSLAGRPLPRWYDDAKLGIMIHWGVWAVPGWAETTLDPERVADPTDPDYFLAPGGVERFVRHNPYTEWYENSLAIDGTATREFHRTTYGADFPYVGFQPLFEEQAERWNPDAWASLFAEARARYVVLVTKHHDGFTLWPSAVENPRRPGWNAARDIVGELADSVRARCLRFGAYYSGGIDWSFTPPPIETLLDFLDTSPPGRDYARYVEAHYRELIERYRPSILWNDITSPALTDEAGLFSDYYAAVPDGVVNDRWGLEPGTPAPDFRTVEYDVRDEIAPDKWEAVRGIGRAFGYNGNQSVADYGTPEKYLHLLIDVVSKNGNLLLNVGPMADGTIPEPQVAILRALGGWLALYGEAIFATRPWTRFAGTTDEDIPVRFTRAADGRTAYAILLATPAGDGFTLRGFPETPARIHRVGEDGDLDWERTTDGIRISLAQTLPALPAHAFAIELAVE